MLSKKNTQRPSCLLQTTIPLRHSRYLGSSPNGEEIPALQQQTQAPDDVITWRSLRKNACIVAAIVAVPQAVVDLGPSVAGGSLLA
jgi:hypothetical protein